MPNWARHAIAHTKHISTCSGAPWHAVIEPHRTARVSSVRSIETLDETTIKNGHRPKAIPVIIDYQCVHLGETHLTPINLIITLLRLLLSSPRHFR